MEDSFQLLIAREKKIKFGCYDFLLWFIIFVILEQFTQGHRKHSDVCKTVTWSDGRALPGQLGGQDPSQDQNISCQLVFDRLPSSSQVATRHCPSDDKCVMCGQSRTRLTSSSRVRAKFVWSVLRKLLGIVTRP